MSRPDLYDLAFDHGGPDLIPDGLCAELRIGQDRVWKVLVHRLLHADPVGVVYWGTPRLAEDLRLDRRDVRKADSVLIHAGLMVAVGKRGRANSYRMLPKLIDSIAEAHGHDMAGEVAGEVAGDVACEVAGDVAGDVACIPATKKKGREVKSNHRRAETERPPQRQRPTDDLTEAEEFLNTIWGLTGHRIHPTPKAKAVAAQVIRGRYDAPGALDTITEQGHDINDAGPGLILNLLADLPPRLYDIWRDSLPPECPHPGTEHLERKPNLCWDCRAEAGDPKARQRREAAADIA